MAPQTREARTVWEPHSALTWDFDRKIRVRHSCPGSRTAKTVFHYNIPHMDSLIIAGREFRSRLIVGTGKYKSFQETARALEASGADMVTVAVRRVNLDRSKES